MSRPHKKVLIIGIDGGTWNVFGPAIERGHMPNLKALRDGGCFGALRSTDPPVTPTAWTTMMTGVNPGKHGVYGFEHYDPATNRLHFTNSQSIRFETMWSYLSRLGYRVASLNVPQTYPPFPVNGVMVSGYGCPGKSFNYTYPPELKQLIDGRIPDYDMALHWEKGDVNDLRLLERNMAYCMRSFDAIHDMVRLVEDKYGWDVMLAEIQQIDIAEHHIYRLLTPEGWRERPEMERPVVDMLNHLDAVIGKLAERVSGPDELLILASDHGLGPFKAKVKPNNLLCEWGFLKKRSGLRWLGTKMKRSVLRMLGRKMTSGKGSESVADKLKLDWSGTRAFVAHTEPHAFLFLNLKGRQPEGIVEPGEQAREIVEELRARFLDVRDPVTGGKIFAAAQTPQEMFGVSDEKARDVAELILAVEDGYLPGRSPGGTDFFKASSNNIGGSHYREGMFLLSGARVERGRRMDADIADIAPTVYAALGVPLPEGLDGKALESAFAEPLATTTGDSAGGAQAPAPARSSELSAEEEELIQKRLADLGYLE